MKVQRFFSTLGEVGLHYSLRGNSVVRNSQKKCNPEIGSYFMDTFFSAFPIVPSRSGSFQMGLLAADVFANC